MKNVLFVDDDTAFLGGLRRSLYRKGRKWNICFAVGVDEAIDIIERNQIDIFGVNVDEAIDIIERNQIDIIVTDLKMPLKNGYCLLEFLKMDSKTSNIVTIVLTGMSNTIIHKHALSLGAECVIEKPIDTDKLIEYIDKY